MNATIDPHNQHAVYAPSSAKRWLTCTASAEAISRLPEQESNEAADSGTEGHNEMERCFGSLNGELVNPATMTVQPVNPDHEHAWGVALIIDFVRKLPPGQMWIEQRVRLTDQIWGRCDLSHYDPVARVLTILDGKFGFVDVSPIENEQCRIYAGASIMTNGLDPRYIRHVICQPNSIVPGPRLKQWIEPTSPQWPVDPTWEKPDEAFGDFIARAIAVPTGPLNFVAGEQCKYCPLFGRCSASQDVLARLNVALVNAPEEVPAAQRAIFAACKKPVEDWFKSADKAWTKDALKGAVPTGMKLVTTTTRRDWLPEVVDAVRESIVTLYRLEVLELPTPAQAEKLGMDVSTLAAAPAGGPALAFESDKRKPWAPPSAAEMFKDVPKG